MIIVFSFFGVVFFFGVVVVKGVIIFNKEGFLDVLFVDFVCVFKDFVVVMIDLKKVVDLGDLLIVLEKGNVLRIWFLGVDV